MGKRDYRHREPKKQRKESKKTSLIEILPPSAAVEVIKKGRKELKGEE